jgi:hypothetical protein
VAKVKVGSVEVAVKVIFSRLLKNARMQGTSFDRLRINSPEECGVLGRTSQ